MIYHTSTNLRSALHAIKGCTPKIVAGCTDVYPSMMQGKAPEDFLNITRIKELRGFVYSINGTSISAAVTALYKQNDCSYIMAWVTFAPRASTNVPTARL